MPGARQRGDARIRQRRQRLAHEAARLMAEGGLHDFQQAKRKAASRLGIHDEASLPQNREIEDALRQYQRLFNRDTQPAALRRRREAALEAMTFLAPFEPRLAGAVLEGTADTSSPIELHLHADDPDAVARFLQQQGIPAQARTRRLRRDRQGTLDCPAWRFIAGQLDFELVVLPREMLRQAPLSSLDDKPARRASATQLRRLLQQQAGEES